MKKLMKKKVSLFGKEFSVFALIAVAMVTLVSAALVPYLSNAVSGAFGTSSPLLLEISSDGSSWVSASGSMPIALESIYGGEITTFWLQVTNNADVGVDPVDLHATLSSDYGTGLEATCNDFTWVTITSDRNSGSGFEGPVLEYNGPLADIGCDDSSGTIVIVMDSQYLAGEVEEYEIELTADLAIAPSNYTITAREMVQLAE